MIKTKNISCTKSRFARFTEYYSPGSHTLSIHIALCVTYNAFVFVAACVYFKQGLGIKLLISVTIKRHIAGH